MSILLSWGFPTDDATISATSQAGNMLASNLQNQQPQSMWRSTGVNNQDITFDFGTAQTMRLFYIENHNLTTGAWISVFFSSDNFTTIANQLSYNVTNPYVLGLGMEPLGVCTLGSTDICNPLPGTKLRNFYLFASQVYRYAKVRINDPFNADGYVQAGRIVLANYWQPTNNVDFGYKQNLGITSDGSFSRSGAWYARRRNQQNLFSMQFSFLSDGETATMNNMIRIVDRDKNIFFAAFPDESTAQLANNLGLCFLESHSGVTYSLPQYREFQLNLREAV